VIEVFLVGCLVGTSAWQVWRAVQLWRRSVLHAGGLFCSYELWRLWNGTGVGGLMSLACSLLCDFCWNVEPKRCSRIQFTSFAASSWTRRLQCHSGYTTWLIKGSCERVFCSQLQKVAVTSSLRSKCWSVPSIHDSLGWHMLPGSSRTLREGRRSCKQGKQSWTRGRRYAGHWSCIYSAVSISLQDKTITNPFLSSR